MQANPSKFQYILFGEGGKEHKSNLLPISGGISFKGVNCFIVSNIKFCPTVWHYWSISDTKKMEKIQERALRFVYCGLNFNTQKHCDKSPYFSLFRSMASCFPDRHVIRDVSLTLTLK